MSTDKFPSTNVQLTIYEISPLVRWCLGVSNRPHNVRIASETVYKQYKIMFTSKYAYKMATKKFDHRRAQKKHIDVNLFSTDVSVKSEICIAVVSEHN